MPLVSLWLFPLVATFPARVAAAPAPAEDVCEPAFDLVIPADLMRARGKAGLTVLTNVAGEGTGLGFDLRATSCTLTARVAGQRTLLGQWQGESRSGDIVLKRRPGKVAVAYGAATVVRAVTSVPDGGRWELPGVSPDEVGRVACQPIGDIVLSDDFMRGPDEQSPWTDVSGVWMVNALESAQYSANAFSFAGRGEARHSGLTTTGDWFWEDYTVGVSVQAGAEAPGFGVGLCYQAGPHVHLLRWVRRPDGGALQLVRVEGAREEVLATAPCALQAGEWHRLVISGVEGKLVGEMDGVPLLAAEDPTLAHGQAALWVAGEGPVHFDDVDAYDGPIRRRPPTVLAHAKEAADPAAAQFINDHYMEGWADESDQWVPSGGPSIWHSGVFWGDVELAWDAPPAALTAPVALTLCAPIAGAAADAPADSAAGYHLRIAPEAGRLSVTLAKGLEVRASAAAETPTGPVLLVFRRTGNRLEALIGDRGIASFDDSEPFVGGKAGLSGAGATSEAARLAITSRNVLDSAFRSAPVEWRVGGGVWGVQSRWACTPRWSWFGGRSDGLAAIWTRDRFAGDVIVDFFASVPMDSPFAPFYRHPSNLGVTLGSDGRTLGTGYSLIVGGSGNRETAILRRGEVVARTAAVRLPDIIDSFGGLLTPDAAIELHKSWRHIRAERIGGTLRLLVDGRLALTYTDPQPLGGGPVCLWTLDNGIMVARARVYYEGTATAAADNGEPTTGGDVSAGKTVEGVVASGPARVRLTDEPGGEGGPRRCAAITNVTAGGAFSVRAVAMEGADLRRRPLLSFDYAIPPEVRIDAYLTVAGQRYRLRLTGPGVGVDGTEEIGGVPGVAADGKWHHAEANLLDRLAPLFPTTAPIMLDDLQLANHAQPEYLAVGIGGNGAGASYRLAGLTLKAAPRGSATASQVPATTRTEASEPLARVRCDFERDLGGFRPWGVDAGATLRRAHTPVAGNEQGGQWCLEVRNGQLGGLFGLEVGCLPFEATRYPRLAFDYRATDLLRVDLLVDVAGARREIKFTDNDATWPVIGSLGAVADDKWHHAEIDLAALLRSAFPGRRALPVTRLAFASSGWPGNRQGATYWLDNFEVLAAPPTPTEDRTPPVLRDPSPAPGEVASTRQIAVTVTDAGSGVSPADLRLRVGTTTYTLADDSLGFDESSGRLTWTAPGSGPVARDGEAVACEVQATDLAGDPSPPLSWTWRVDHTKDTEPPPAPVVSYFPSDALFADDFETGKGGWGDFFSCQALRRETGGATGPGCLELTELGVAPPGMALVQDFGPEWTPFPRLRLQYRAAGAVGASLGLHGTTWDGTTDYWTLLATLPTQSEAWQTLSVDLSAALKAANPALTMHRLFLSVGISQPSGAVLIDDAVMYSPASTGARFTWGEPADASGIAGYSWQLDHRDGAGPDEVVDGTQREVSFRDLTPGHWCFHVRARDGAGHWGEASHLAFEVEAAH